MSLLIDFILVSGGSRVYLVLGSNESYRSLESSRDHCLFIIPFGSGHGLRLEPKMAHRSFANDLSDEALPDPRDIYSRLNTALQDSLKVRPLKTIIIKVDHLQFAANSNVSQANRFDEMILFIYTPS